MFFVPPCHARQPSEFALETWKQLEETLCDAWEPPSAREWWKPSAKEQPKP